MDSGEWGARLTVELKTGEAAAGDTDASGPVVTVVAAEMEAAAAGTQAAAAAAPCPKPAKGVMEARKLDESELVEDSKGELAYRHLPPGTLEPKPSWL